MWASEDSADDEFVFVANNRTVGVTGRDECGWPRTQPHPQHRLNQPIPTSLELGPAPGPCTWPVPATTTTARSRVTPLPPELIELLPPHLRENTVPDYTTPALPRRPPLPSGYSRGDYCNLDDTPTPSPSPAKNYDFLSELSELVAWDIKKPASQDQGHSGRVGSVSLTRPASRSHPTPTTASHTAPAALALTDSGISSGSSSSSSGGSSSVSSRCSSNKSLVKEGSVTTQGVRQWQPPSPKFSRPSVSTNTTTTDHSLPQAAGSYSAVVGKDGEKTCTSRHHETPQSQSPLLHHFRAASNGGDVMGGQSPHIHHVTTAYTTITGDSHTNPAHGNTPPGPAMASLSHPHHNTPNHLFIWEEKLANAESRPSAGGMPGRAGVDVGGGRGSARDSPLAPCHALSSTPKKPTRPHPLSASPSYPTDVKAKTPPSSPEMRRAWNVVGVPPGPRVEPGRGSPTVCPIRVGARTHSDPDGIYDNLVVRRTTSTSPPSSIISYGDASANMSSRRLLHYPVAGKPPSPPMQRRGSRSPTPTSSSRPSSPQCLANPASGSRPSSPQCLAYHPTAASGSRPSSPQCLAYHPSQDLRQAGCWIPVWGSSPQLCQDAGAHFYPTCAYNAQPCTQMCGARSHSCDRLPVRPSPPSSPTPYNGQRSASPWRGGSASPAGARHSPSPDRSSGRPPRPRRPSHRKSKTVEVGYLGLGAHPGAHATPLAPSPAHSVRALTYLPAPPLSRPTTSGVCGHPPDNHILARQQYNPDFEIMPGQHRVPAGVECEALVNGGVPGGWPHYHATPSPCATSPCSGGRACMTPPCAAPPLASPTLLLHNKELTNGTKQKGVSRGSGCGSPALSHPVAPPAPPTSPMPRLLASTGGLSSSASRLSGGALTSCTALGSNRLAASYVALGSSASSGYGSCSGAAVASSRHEDSEDLSDVSSGATSEDSNRRRRRRSAQSMKGEASVSGNEDFEWVRGSPMLTGLLEGQVTRLATPPDHRTHAIRSSLATPPESGEEISITPRHRQYPRPPPVPRPRTLEAGELVPHRPLRDPRDGLRDRLYSPIRDLSGHRRSRDSSVERSVRDTSCDRASVSSLHHLHHHHAPQRLPLPCDCWCDEDEHGYDSCDERNHQHRHSYHEGLHRAHLHHLQPHPRHHHQHQHHQPSREASRERRSRGHGSGDSGRSSPCFCRNQHLGSLSSLASQDVCNSGRLALPCTSKGGGLEERLVRLEGDKDSLQLQVTVLGEQVEAQAEKITDLEGLLQEKRDQLNKAEEQLQKEIMARTSLETQRLELFSEISNLKLCQAAYERENVDLREKVRRLDLLPEHAKVQVGGPLSNSPSPSSISTLSTIPASSPNKSPGQPTTASPASSPLAPHDTPEILPPRTPPPNARRKIDQFGTVPRGQREAENNHGGPAGAGRAKGVMFGKGFNFIPFRVAGKRSTSAPNLAETEMQMIDDIGEGEAGQQDIITSPPPRSNTLTTHRSPPTNHKATGIKKIFTRLRRSSSGHLDGDLGDGDFRRGGMRATASARLGWTSSTAAFKEPSQMFSNWCVEAVEAWLSTLGLGQYCPGVRSWTSSGHHLSKATPHQLERDLGIRHPLHRKKLQLAIASRKSGEQLNTPLHRLDHAWVLRWLDDVGLPQYKDAFSEARVDGRVLNCLTFDDLSFLRLTNLLHVTSLKRGIQVLREHNFDPSVLKRRSVPDEDLRSRTAAQVALWTNHRVMEWLRTVDLSEYAPNLRGSGVHGALMVYEVRFTSELLASLLSIPCGKTLLRRHLNTHFKELVGRTVVQEKRELEAASGYTPLTTSAKVKMPKKSQFSLKRKKSKSELEFEDLLCPLDEKPPIGAVQAREAETNGDGRLC